MSRWSAKQSCLLVSWVWNIGVFWVAEEVFETLGSTVLRLCKDEQEPYSENNYLFQKILVLVFFPFLLPHACFIFQMTFLR